ncbi:MULTISPECIES: helix-turn-helix domain-containing protein [Xanthocytophaga]|uniref:Helix-turn-helix domain-containing protein n=2 Tax=Xanthocytophaga TaxID=3078918 RepID=A0AAE3R0S6_9BACT|nr:MULTISPECIES: helix-turn-helix domain-containing protein [Xanthocytophaga]MDJ1473369.1 helix-turn-helix domain-containing protein [Xanthocytophaga flavus]MDJ1481562.1 helix-turn-helix domain-containing protein [Xanthocytophaga flavus]MDJ1486008.1 helix-turn-helix domain-containing protein [Xanthocytophaga flavus]MDJ1501714.1 helix-turn-helix domain-containing protein [Xanthocytophaga agilis]MDJ1501985.1 helix-turn-helix domain-containing protein [Xanthocytophaga agilis]
MSLQHIGQRIYHLRVEILQIPQWEFAQRTGTAQGNLSSLEKGRSLPSCFFLWSLQTTFHTDLNWLITGEGEPIRPSGNKRKNTLQTTENQP